MARVRRPLLVFGVAEILIGLSALATPVALDAASAIYQRLHQLNPDSLTMLTVARLVTGFVVLLVPTMLMGLTLPVLSASSLVRGSPFGARVERALCGQHRRRGHRRRAGRLLSDRRDRHRSVVSASAPRVNVDRWRCSRSRCRAAGRCARRRRHPESRLPAPASPRSAVSRRQSAHVIGAVVAISGFVALALEIVWFRMLVQYLAATTYAFTTMLATVLAGIAIGGAIAARLLRRAARLDAWLACSRCATARRCAGVGDLPRLELRAGLADVGRLAGERRRDSAGDDR